MSKQRCLGCRSYFDKETMLKLPVGNFHEFACATEYATKKANKDAKAKVKKDKQDHTAAKRRLRDNDNGFQDEKAQAYFNKWVRVRDYGKNCISCNKPPKKKNAGHYKSRGAFPELRFHPLNCHLQCEHCNTHLSANLSNYRINLISKIGIDKVEWLEGPHEPKRYTIDNLKTIQKWFKRKTKRLEARGE